ncbi:MAG: glycosyltransferase, partial [Verrucomicrobiota bacterium]|nr:glycosyltransferase [Verrucomicrobiota bacterium]
VAGYRAYGLRCFHLPLGYHPILERQSSQQPVERDLDICLLASLTDRREKFLAENADFFAVHECHLRLVPLEFAKTETTRSYLADKERNELLQRARILLNVHYSDLRYFEWHRMLVGLANGCCIVTETCEGFAPLVPGQHFVMVEKEALVRACDYYLKHPAERAAIARAGRDFVRARLTQAESCADCIAQIMQADERSLGERSSEKEIRPSDTSLGALWYALKKDLNHFIHPEAHPAAPDPDAEAKTIATIKKRRQGYAERYAQQEAARREGKEPLEIFDNDAFRASLSPAISIIVTLYNYENYIRPCLESVEQAEVKDIPGGIEVLIINDASTDTSLDRAREARRESTLPVRIITKQFNTGLADARNVGLRLARAPYAFIMDADNLIFPRALDRLYHAIRAAESAAAYSMLCRFRGETTSYRGLLSAIDWDPGMLVQAPYIDAMALFDRRILLELGGYDNTLYQVGWFGWEDYELWLRMAAAHLPVEFVPNILCLYRQHETSMSRTTNLFEVDLVRHLIVRYQALIDEYPPKKQIFGVEWERFT